MAKRISLIPLLILFLFHLGCYFLQPQILFLPSRIEGIEGYASLRLNGRHEEQRGRFSYLIELPGNARIETMDPLGRTVSLILITEESSFFILPKRRVFFQGKEREVIEKFLGLSLALEEVVSLFLGRWEKQEGNESLQHWVFQHDRSGRIVRGRKGEWEFDVREFFPQSQVARIISFSSPESQGTLRILRIRFNPKPGVKSFDLSFLRNWERKNWEEMEAILRELRQ